MKNAIYIGSFDPIHITHINVLRNASLNIEKITVLIFDYDDKTYNVNILTRAEWVREALKEAKLDIEVIDIMKENFEEYILNNKIDTVIRRLKKTTELGREEVKFKEFIHKIKEDIDINYIVTGSKLTSSSIRRAIRHGHDLVTKVEVSGKDIVVELLPKIIKVKVIKEYNG